ITIEILGAKVKFRDVRVFGNATNTGEGIYVKGQVKTTADCTCSLCLASFPLDIAFPFEETYYRDGEASSQRKEEAVRTYEGDEIDLGDVIEEGLILALPMKPLCSPDCKGLCPVCGCDLNQQQCSCDTQTIDPRLAVLKDFFKEK
ncbi:MAG: YceD family protein, partial [Thermacetogeniaceae bacterium]